MNVKKNSPRQKTEILIVEDSRTQAEQLKHILEKHEYKVSIANNGKQALSFFGKHKPALIISDIIMPEMNGYELCKSIKTDFGDEEIPVILLTSLSDAEDVLEGLACGADNFITKPYSEDYILSSISQILANRNLRKDERIRIGVEIVFGGKKRFITAEQQQMLTLLISSYEAAVHKNKELTQTQEKLKLLNENLENLVEKRTTTLSEEIEKRKRVELQIKAALNALKGSEENFRRSLEDSPLGVRIATVKGETIYINKATLEIYGYESLEEFCGIPIKERYTPQSYAEFQLRKKAREEGDFGPSEYEINIVRKNGEIRHLQVLRKEVLWNGTKQFQVIYQDISERKQAESQREAAVEALQVSEKKLNEAQALGQIGNWEFDINTQKSTWSKQVYKLYERDPVLGPPTTEEEAAYYSPEQGQILRGYTRNAIETGQFFEYDLQATLPSGKHVYLAARMRPIKDAQGRVIKLFGIVQDITERKQAEEKIKNSLVEKEVLLKEVHHRVKNNLMIIIGLIKMEETKVANEMLNPLLQQLEGRIRSMALVHASLYKSKDLAHIDLQNYIETMSAQIHAQFGTDRDIRFSVQAAGMDVDLDSAVPCGLILNELLTNAFKYAFPAGRPGSGAGDCEIKVIVNQEGGMNLLTVADNGVGLPADLDWEKSETLGLRLIKMLSKQINGSIELDRSTGTVFCLKFPVAL